MAKSTKKEVAEPVKSDVAEAARIFDMLGDPTRLGILDALGKAPATVTALCDVLALKQANLSHHLGLLRHTGLVDATRDGRNMVYAIRPEGTKAAMDFLASL
jgi:ArsR family transcriptional regulator